MGIGPRAMAFAAVLGIAQFALNFNFVYRAEQHITSGLVAVLFALLIVPNTLLGRAFMKTPLEGSFLAGAGSAIVGGGLLILHEYRDRKSVEKGESVAVRVDFGGCGSINKKIIYITLVT